MRFEVVVWIFFIVPFSVPDDKKLQRNMIEIRLNYHIFERDKVMRRLAFEESGCVSPSVVIEGQRFYANESVVIGKLFTVVEEEFIGIFTSIERHIVKYVYVTIIVNF
jgi:hypothetical protein